MTAGTCSKDLIGSVGCVVWHKIGARGRIKDIRKLDKSHILDAS